MAYFNYHAKAKSLIMAGHCVKAVIVENYKDIGPSLVLYFDNHIPMPVRPYKFHEYFGLLKKYDVKTDTHCFTQ